MRHIFRFLPSCGKPLLLCLAAIFLSACVTSRVEDVRTGQTGLVAGEGIVIMAKSYHLGNQTEAKFISCVGNSLARGASGFKVIPNADFVDSLFPWFEPRTAPAKTEGLAKLMTRPGVASRIEAQGIRYIVWLDGNTDKVASGGSMSCAAGPGGGGCFGFAWWQDDSNYEASIWDLQGQTSAGTVSTDVSGTSFMPALVIPIPLIARTQAKACKGLADQLSIFLRAGDQA